jgi:hypothetical protein
VLAGVVGQRQRRVGPNPLDFFGNAIVLDNVTVPAARFRIPNGDIGMMTTPFAGVGYAKPAVKSPARMSSTSSLQVMGIRTSSLTGDAWLTWRTWVANVLIGRGPATAPRLSPQCFELSYLRQRFGRL